MFSERSEAMEEQEEVVRHLPLPRRLTPPWQSPIRPQAAFPGGRPPGGISPFPGLIKIYPSKSKIYLTKRKMNATLIPQGSHRNKKEANRDEAVFLSDGERRGSAVGVGVRAGGRHPAFALRRAAWERI